FVFCARQWFLSQLRVNYGWSHSRVAYLCQEEFMIRTFVSFLGILMLLTTVAELASAQVLYGSAVGMVEDQTGSSVSNATVTMTNKASGVIRTTNTGADGRFTLPSLLPGAYDLKVTASGFKTLTKTEVEVTINTVTRVDAQLEIGTLTEQVTVE